jgi:cell fate regulator YaaT (PSP1 superfamily)
MAKDQDLPVNPLKISGACGRLLCCLKYEHPLYQEANNKWPKRGERVETPEGEGTVLGKNVPGESLTVRMGDGSQRRCALSSVCGSRRTYEEAHGEGPVGESSPAVAD